MTLTKGTTHNKHPPNGTYYTASKYSLGACSVLCLMLEDRKDTWTKSCVPTLKLVGSML